MLVGIVYYADDKKVFRVVYPTFDDKELDEPATDRLGQHMLKGDGVTPHQWHTFGVDPNRVAIFEKILAADLAKYERGTV